MDLCYKRKSLDFLLVFLLGLLHSCSSPNDKKETLDFVPKFIVRDSLVIDYLGNLSMLDIKANSSEFLFYDFQRNEFVRVNAEGEILQQKNLKEDSKDGFGSFFLSCHYLPSGEIVVFTFEKMYRYDGELRLLNSSELPFSFFTNTVFGGHINLVHKGMLFTNVLPEDVNQEFFKKQDFLASHPFLTIFDLEKEEILTQTHIPSEAAIIRHPGKYRETAPFSLIHEDHLYLLFPNSPEIYKYKFPELELLEWIDLSPEKEYVQTEPTPINGESFGVFFDGLASSDFTNLYASNGYFMTSYNGAAPKDEVDALPRNVVGDERYKRLEKTYKIPYYQIIKDGEKIWEDHLDIDFRYKQGQLYARRNLHLPKVDEELDYLTFYFYEIN